MASEKKARRKAAATAACGCGVVEARADRKAVAVDLVARESDLARLRHIEEQVRGLDERIEEDRHCADGLAGVSSVHQAVRAVARELLRNTSSTARARPCPSAKGRPRRCDPSSSSWRARMCAEAPRRRAPAAFAAALLLAACRATPSEATHLDASHPASAEAPAGTLPVRSDVLAPDAAAVADHDAPAHTGHGGSAPAASEPRFVCPMHPEVTSGAPGRCPECGMRLEAVEADDQGGDHDHPGL